MKIWLAGIGLMLLTAVVGQAAATDPAGCEIDWTNNLYISEGQAFVQNPKQIESKEKALSDARKSAVTKMMALIQKSSIQGLNPSQILAKNPAAKSKIMRIVNMAKPADSRFMTFDAKSVAVVTLKIPVFGQDGPGTVIITAGNVSDTTSPPTRNVSASGYTSLIVDASGLNIRRSMCPRIINLAGDIVYSGENATIDQIESSGIAAYAKSLERATSLQRCGQNPLMIKATGSFGMGNWDVVVSDDDADLIRIENNKFHFLDKLNVIIVVN